MAWPTQSVPARVERANWNGAQAASTALPNCFANVLATNLRKDVSVAIPRTPPSCFFSAVIVAAMNALVTGSGASALAKSSAARKRSWSVSASSKHAFNISLVHPPGSGHFPRVRWPSILRMRTNPNPQASGDWPTPLEGSLTPVHEDVALAIRPRCRNFLVPVLRQSTLDEL